MKDRLNNSQLQYVLFHIEQHIDLSPIKSLIAYSDKDDTNKIIFRTSDKEIDKTFFIIHDSKNLPVLFPLSEETSFYCIENNRLVFNHDILKAIFYLLSGYQEHNSPNKDFMERFPYEHSIQKELNITSEPVVNYYIAIISEALIKFAAQQNIQLKTKRLFETAGFLLSHDIDRVNYYHWRETVYRWMQILGLRKANYNKKRLFNAAIDSILPTIFPGYKPDPFRNFKTMRKMEKKYGMVSSWYFLNRDGSDHDARYYFKEKSIRDIMNFLYHENCEIGLHGSLKTSSSKEAMIKALNKLKASFNYEVPGTRQHYLKFSNPDTYRIQQQCGIKYDTTVGFAEHEGYRNSYCYPFHPYNFDNDTMMDIWEFPLIVMDGTLFYYREHNYESAMKSIENLLIETLKFGGIFTLLWHNSFFDEYEFPGITNFYNNLLKSIHNNGCESLTGADLLNRIY